MKIVHVGRLQRASAARKAGYLEAHQKIGKPVTIFGQPFLQLTDGDYATIRREFTLAPASPMKSVSSLSGTVPAQKSKIGFGVKQRDGASWHGHESNTPHPGPLPASQEEGVDSPQDGGSIKARPKPPTFGAMAKNVVGAAGRVITAAAAGQAVQASEGEFQRRMKICAACKFLDKGSQRCGKCGCFVAAQVIGKARLATEKCPENKW